jgi:hypothetical protein
MLQSGSKSVYLLLGVAAKDPRLKCRRDLRRDKPKDLRLFGGMAGRRQAPLSRVRSKKRFALRCPRQTMSAALARAASFIIVCQI